MDHEEERRKLNNRSFQFEDNRYDVIDTRFMAGKYYIYTLQEKTFVKTIEQFERFVKSIVMLPDTQELQVQANHGITAETSAVIVAGSNNVKVMQESLMAELQVLNGTPTDADYKRIEAKSKLSNTLVSIAQTQINLIRLQKG